MKPLELAWASIPGWIRFCLMVVLVSSLLLACGGDDSSKSHDDDDDNDDDEKSDGDDNPDDDVVETPFADGEFEETGIPLVDRMLSAAEQCGTQNPNTVPPGWRMVLAGEQGCTFMAPPDWEALGAGTTVTLVQEDANGTTGFILMGGVPDLQAQVDCSPSGVSQYMAANMEQTGCADVQTLLLDVYTEDFLGQAVPMADYFYSCRKNSVSLVGYQWISIHGTQPLCNILVLGLWMSQEQIEAKACTLTQIMNSIKCPSGASGDCDDASCANSCREQDAQGGACNDNDECVCFSS